MAIRFRVVADVKVGSTLIIERHVANKDVHIVDVIVSQEPFQKNGVWYIPVKTAYDEHGNVIDYRDDFVNVTEYTPMGMFKLSDAKLIYLNKKSVIITKGVFKLINRRSSVRTPVSIQSSFKIAGESVWVKSTTVDLSLTGCRMRASVHNFDKEDCERLNERKPNISLTFNYEDFTIRILGTLQRASIVGNGILEIGCKCEDNVDYRRMCISEQIAAGKVRKDSRRSSGVLG